MKLTVYIDLLILINVLTNYIFIKLVSMLTSSDASTKRILFSSVTGSLFSLIILFDMPEIMSFIIRILFTSACVYLSFGYENRFRFVKQTFTLLAIYMLFTGFLLIAYENSDKVYINNCSFYISINPVSFVGMILIFYLLLTTAELIFCRHDKNYIYNVTVEMQYGSFTSTAFYDTGFKVKDLLCNNDVIMCSLDFLKKQKIPKISEDISAFYHNGTHSNIPLLPLFYSDMSGTGMLAAFPTQKITVKNKSGSKELKNVIVAVSKTPFSHQYEMIFGTDIYRRLGD